MLLEQHLFIYYYFSLDYIRVQAMTIGSSQVEDFVTNVVTIHSSWHVRQEHQEKIIQRDCHNVIVIS